MARAFSNIIPAMAEMNNMLAAAERWALLCCINYDNTSRQGYVTIEIIGENLYPRGHPLISTVIPTQITLYGDAIDNYNWDAARNTLLTDPSKRGRHYYRWQVGGTWQGQEGSPPYLCSK
jgi:hypothetical protein